MTAYYVDSSGNNSDGLTWAKAFTTFAGAVSAATASGDIIYVDQGFTDTLSAATTYTFGNNVRVICSNDKVNEPPQTLGVMGTSAWIGNNAINYTITLSGAYKIFIQGITFRTINATMTLFNNDGVHAELENCYFWTGTTRIGGQGDSWNSFFVFRDCTFRFGATDNFFEIWKNAQFYGGSISSSGSKPTTLFNFNYNFGTSVLLMEGFDLSYITSTLFYSGTGCAYNATFVNCKIGSGVTILPTQVPANKGSNQVTLYNCSSTDQHYHLGHYDAFGSTVVDTGIYANDGASYDGTNRCSWKVVTTAHCSYYTPYVSPWIDCYHSGTSAITPSLEIVRSGSATAYQDDEVWGEFSYQGTSGFPLATIVSDRKGLLASAADQTTGALGAGDWTGENATSWFGKLNPTSAITPAEIGHLRARVCVGEPSVTVYVDPTIRGRS